MIKKILLLSLLGVSLTGCVVAPYDDDYGYGHKSPSHNHGKQPSHSHGKPPSHSHGKPPSHSQGKPPSHSQGKPPSYGHKPYQHHKPNGNNHGGKHNSQKPSKPKGHR